MTSRTGRANLVISDFRSSHRCTISIHFPTITHSHLDDLQDPRWTPLRPTHQPSSSTLRSGQGIADIVHTCSCFFARKIRGMKRGCDRQLEERVGCVYADNSCLGTKLRSGRRISTPRFSLWETFARFSVLCGERISTLRIPLRTRGTSHHLFCTIRPRSPFPFPLSLP
jgi:hypothetical protein